MCRLSVLLLALLAVVACAEPTRQIESRSGVAKPESASATSEPEPWSDPWMLREGQRFLGDTTYRRAALEHSLVNPDNLYSHQRLASYGLGDRRWDRLPQWNPRALRVTAELAAQLERDEVPAAPAQRLWDGIEPTTMEGWVALGRKVFFGYPMRAEVYMEWGLTKPSVAEAVGLERSAEGDIPGLVLFVDVDREVRVGITCAICHTSVEQGRVVEGSARRSFDYGRLRLEYFSDTGAWIDPAVARRMATWGPGRADVTEDDDEDPVTIPDLWGLRHQRWLTQAGTIRHDSPLALAIRQETQLTDSNHSMVRPPRALAWALAMYVYSLEPPKRPVVDHARGKVIFEGHCASCHRGEGYSGRVIAAAEIGTDPALAMGRGRGTGMYRVPSLLRVADGAPYLHDGSVASLGELLSPARLRPEYAAGHLGPGSIPGHTAGTDLSDEDTASLLEFLRSI
ncbi:MAG: c-type cytochrome [Nannocystaceae bacterium]|nr:c-type cytochrome [Nannocystaceae bacterium]